MTAYKGFATSRVVEEFKYYPWLNSDFRHIPKGAYFIIVPVSGIRREFKTHEGCAGWGYMSAWNGSYHAASYAPALYAWAKGRRPFRKARKMLADAQAWLKDERILKDSANARFEARRQVRSGD